MDRRGAHQPRAADHADALQGWVFAAVTQALFAPQPVAHALGAAAITQVDFRLACLTTAVVTLTTGLSLSSDAEA